MSEASVGNKVQILKLQALADSSESKSMFDLKLYGA